MTIAVAYNFTREGDAAVRLAVHEAQLRRAPLLVVHATKAEQVSSEVVGQLREHVRDTLGGMDASGLEWSVEVLPGGQDVADAVIEAAAHAEADVLVLGAPRRTAVGKLVFGSTVEQILLRAPMPVFVTKAG